MNKLAKGIIAKAGQLFIGGFPYGAVKVCNKSNSSIAAGKLVYISGYDATLDLPTIDLADADNAAKAAQFITHEAIADDSFGLVYEKQEIDALNTNAGSVSDPVYLSDTAGGWTLVAPSGADQIVQIVGFITVKSATVGKIMFLLQPRNVTVVGTSGVQGGTLASLTDAILKVNVYSSVALTAGELLHISGYNAANSCFVVEKADGDNKPAQLIASAINAGGAKSEARFIYELDTLNTNAATVGDPVYADTATAGGWTLTPPSGADQLAQIVGRVTVKNVATGKIKFNLSHGFEGVLGTSYIQNLAITAAKLAGSIALDKHLDDDSHSIFFVKGEIDFGESNVVDTDLGALGYKGTLIGGYCQLTEAQVGGDATTVITVGKVAGGGTAIAGTVTITLANTAEGQSNKVGYTKAIDPVAGGVDIAAVTHIYVYAPDDVAGTRSAGKLKVFLLFQKSA